MINVDDFNVFPAFQGVSSIEYEWLAKHAQEKKLKPKETFFEQGDKAVHLILILEGKLNLVRYEKGKEVSSFQMEAGEITGLIPFSRMVSQGGTAYALESCRLALVDSSLFKHFHKEIPTILERLVNYMLDRSRTFTQANADREKLISLGTMSAGLAHELNNPASAAKRAAQNLNATLKAFNEHSSSLLKPVIFKDSNDPDPFKSIFEASTLDGESLSTLERSDREDTLVDWLEENDVQEAWEVAATLVSGGLSLEEIQPLANKLQKDQVRNFLTWVPKDIELRLLAKELIESTTRISDLVSAMKAYTYMDKDIEKQDTNIQEGIINTLIILKHKWKKKNLTINKEFTDLPLVQAYGSELNQVWTNLISNAIDALSDDGTITIRSYLDSSAKVVVIDIIDDGVGIPEEKQNRIFEPFYTTKGVGEGTGMGLDIVNRIVRQRHRGTVSVKSSAGTTLFRVRLPIE